LALDEAKRVLTRAVEQYFEPELRRLYQNNVTFDEVLTEAFEAQCQAVLMPIWTAIHR
jgi:exodeoxyribonuclease V gamma subunit